MRRFAALSLVVALLSVMSLPVLAKGREGGDHKITICHRTNAENNPYRVITVDVSAVDGKGGADHFGRHTGPVFEPGMKADKTKWGDIIPPVEGVHGGLNWNEAGKAIWKNDCKVKTPDTTAPPTTKPRHETLECPDTLDLGQTVVRDNPGTRHTLLTADVASTAQDLEATVIAEAHNNSSVHPGNDLVVSSGDDAVVLAGVEDVSGGTTEAEGTLVLGREVVVTLIMGADGVFSAGITVHFECPEPPETTTTTVPETTTTTTAPPTTAPPTTAPPTTTPPTTTPTTEPPQEEPEFTLYADATCDGIHLNSTVVESVTVRVEFRTEGGAIAHVENKNFSHTGFIPVPDNLTNSNFSWSVSYQGELVGEGVQDNCAPADEETTSTTGKPPTGAPQGAAVPLLPSAAGLIGLGLIAYASRKRS